MKSKKDHVIAVSYLKKVEPILWHVPCPFVCLTSWKKRETDEAKF